MLEGEKIVDEKEGKIWLEKKLLESEREREKKKCVRMETDNRLECEEREQEEYEGHVE